MREIPYPYKGGFKTSTELHEIYNHISITVLRVRLQCLKDMNKLHECLSKEKARVGHRVTGPRKLKPKKSVTMPLFWAKTSTRLKDVRFC